MLGLLQTRVMIFSLRKGWLPFKELYEQASSEHEVRNHVVDVFSSAKLLVPLLTNS